jgi:hypothetical protein
MDEKEMSTWCCAKTTKYGEDESAGDSSPGPPLREETQGPTLTNREEHGWLPDPRTVVIRFGTNLTCAVESVASQTFSPVVAI